MIFNAYRHVRVKLGDEAYDFDRSSLMFSEVVEIENATGLSFGDWQFELGRFSIRAVAGLLHILRKRAGLPSDFQTLEFSVDDLDAVPLHDDGTEFTLAELDADIRRRVKEAGEGPTGAAGGGSGTGYTEYIPAFAEFYGIRPWEWSLMKWADFWILKEAADARLKKPRRR